MSSAGSDMEFMFTQSAIAETDYDFGSLVCIKEKIPFSS